MCKNISNLNTSHNLIESLGDSIFQLISEANQYNRRFSWLLSGGKTPELLFKYLKDKWLNKINWELVDVFWVDERCVNINSKDSNYGQASRLLFQYCDGVTLYPIFKEGCLKSAASTYQSTVCNYINENGPFDFTLLGFGYDGHFASIFNKNDFLSTDHVFVNSSHHHPHKRLTMNISLIFNSKRISVIALGREKGSALRQSRGILGVLPISCKFWVDEDFMEEFKI